MNLLNNNKIYRPTTMLPDGSVNKSYKEVNRLKNIIRELGKYAVIMFNSNRWKVGTSLSRTFLFTSSQHRTLNAVEVINTINKKYSTSTDQSDDNDFRKIQADLEILIMNLKRVLNSLRWLSGHFLVSTANILLFRRKPFYLIEDINQLVNQYESFCQRYNFNENQTELKDKKKLSLLKSNNRLSIDIIICVHNALDDFVRCIDSIRRYTNIIKKRIILIDDGSDSKTANYIEKTAQTLDAQYLRNETALGYTRAANQGLRMVQGDYVVLLNSDTIVTPFWLERMLRCALSDSDVGVVGPLSNCASWQSVPKRTDDNGNWANNSFDSWGHPDLIGERIASKSPRLYPEVNFLNGFCYMINRKAIEHIGFLDEKTFPKGYGEEDDFSIRCLSTGLKLLIADDAYVYHAKSKSFLPERRKKIVQVSKISLAQKHGRRRVKSLLHAMIDNEDYEKATGWASAHLSLWKEGLQRDCHLPSLFYRIGWLQPHLDCVGGIRRCIEMTNRFKIWGAKTWIITPEGKQPDWLDCHSEVISIADALELQFDFLIFSDPDMVELFKSMKSRKRICYHLGAYMMYRKKGAKLNSYYHLPAEVVHIANSKWTAQQVNKHYQTGIEAIFPGGIDLKTFHPIKSKKNYDVACYGSNRQHKGTKDILKAASGLKVIKLAYHSNEQEELAELIGSAKVFVSACYHEGFNFCPLEAMACGVPVVMTDCGGSREYARDNENALVVSPKDVRAIRKAIGMLMKDKKLRIKLIRNGFETAMKFNWDKICTEFAAFLQTQLIQNDSGKIDH